MAVTVEQLIANYGIGEQFTDQRIQNSLDTAAYLVERQHGLDYPGAGKLIRVVYDTRYRWVPMLDLTRQAAAIVSVTSVGGGGVAPQSGYRLLAGGRIVERVAIYWYGQITIDYQPFDDSGVRNDMIGDIAYQQLQANLAYQQASNPQGSPQMFTELLKSQDANLAPILGRIHRPLIVAELPISVEVVDDERSG